MGLKDGQNRQEATGKFRYEITGVVGSGVINVTLILSPDTFLLHGPVNIFFHLKVKSALYDGQIYSLCSNRLSVPF